ATHPLRLIPLGVVFAIVYFVVSYYTIKLFKLKILETELSDDTPTDTDKKDDTAAAFIAALGGADNIVNTDACITRLRMSVKESDSLKDEDFMKLGAKGVIRPDRHSIQIVLGAKAESMAEAIKAAIQTPLTTKT
ncbi:MAG: glucose PTS transporter subunit EIIB, partial [Sulfurovum sp.]|nr:glucose PTS transporter subunit EIIB [Sulfurovum sp.]